MLTSCLINETITILKCVRITSAFCFKLLALKFFALIVEKTVRVSRPSRSLDSDPEFLTNICLLTWFLLAFAFANTHS